MEYTAAAMNKVKELVAGYERELLAEAMSFAAIDLDKKQIEEIHVVRAFHKIWGHDSNGQ